MDTRVAIIGIILEKKDEVESNSIYGINNRDTKKDK